MNIIEKSIINMGFNDINPKICGSEECEPSHSWGPAVRSYWLLHFVVSGCGVLESPRGKTTVEEGSFFIIRPYEVNTYTADKTNPWHYIWVGFTADNRIVRSLMKSDCIHCPKLKDLFLSCIKHKDSTEDSYGYELFLTSKIFEILSVISDIENTSQANYVTSAVNIMENEYSQNITVSKIAERLHLNRSYFTSVFYEMTQKSPGKYLQDLRMEKAEYLISKRNLPVTVVAKSVGFNDTFTFSRAFKTYFGMSPTAYVKSKNKDKPIQ